MRWTDEVHRSRYTATVAAVKRQRATKQTEGIGGLPQKNSGIFPIIAISALAYGIMHPPRGLIQKAKDWWKTATAKRPTPVKGTKLPSQATPSTSVSKPAVKSAVPAAAAVPAVTSARQVAPPPVAATQVEQESSSSSAGNRGNKKKNKKKKGKK